MPWPEVMNGPDFHLIATIVFDVNSYVALASPNKHFQVGPFAVDSSFAVAVEFLKGLHIVIPISLSFPSVQMHVVLDGFDSYANE